MPRLHPATLADAPAPRPEVSVTIGRIEVLPATPEKPVHQPLRKRDKPGTAPRLGDYLRERRSGR